jgi:hypothetical protein
MQSLCSNKKGFHMPPNQATSHTATATAASETFQVLHGRYEQQEYLQSGDPTKGDDVWALTPKQFPINERNTRVRVHSARVDNSGSVFPSEPFESGEDLCRYNGPQGMSPKFARAQDVQKIRQSEERVKTLESEVAELKQRLAAKQAESPSSQAGSTSGSTNPNAGRREAARA